MARRGAASRGSPQVERSQKLDELVGREVLHVLADALAAVRRSRVPLTNGFALRVVTARAAWLCQRGVFSEAAALLREALEAFVAQDGAYTDDTWRGDASLAHQIEQTDSPPRERFSLLPWLPAEALDSASTE